jgi:hypothetical protein
MNTRHLQGPYKHVFLNEAEIEAALKQIEKDELFKTKPKFYKIHLNYLKEHPKVNPEHYLSNLRTVLRIRPK